MKTSRLLPSFALAALALTGCAVGPDYHAPAVPAQVATYALPASTGNTQATVPPWWLRTGNRQLTDLVTRALAGNRDLHAALARLDEAKALRREGYAGFFPVSSISAGYRRQLDSTVFFPGVPRSQRDQNIFDVGIDSAWELDLFGRVRRQTEAQGALAGAAEADLAQLRLLIAAETARAYTELAAAQLALPLQERLAASTQTQLDLLRAQAAEGKILRDRLGPAEAAVTAARDTLRDLRLAERAARNRLGVLVGDGPLPEFATEDLPEIPLPAFPADATQLLTRRPDVRAAERRLAASNAAIGIATADYFPTIGLVAKVGAEATKLNQLDSADANTFAFGPRLRWDLLNLHRTMARVAGAKAQHRQAFAAWENSVLLALEEIDNALAARSEALARNEEWQRTATAMAESAEVARLRGEAGRIDPADALAAAQTALQARIAGLRAQAGLASAAIYLQQSLAVDL